MIILKNINFNVVFQLILFYMQISVIKRLKAMRINSLPILMV